jgi:D-glycero-alpha-D-manno-heptose-7-phosphate kinase
MVIVRAPLRITLGGGGTDLPDWYRQYGGFLVSATINKYIYFTGSKRPFDKKIWLSYSKVEVCDTVEQIKHDLLAKALAKYSFDEGIEIPGRRSNFVERD